MSTPTMIADTQISTLNHPIASLEDQPALSADDLKAYFDANPQQLCDAHNQLVNGLRQPYAATEIGFPFSMTVPAQNVQQAIERVQQQIAGVSQGAVPNGSVTQEKLDSSIQEKLDHLTEVDASITDLQQKSTQIYPFQAQFPLMVLSLADGCPDTLTDELSTAALGYRLGDNVHHLGMQLAWLCDWKQSETKPSDAFRQKNTFGELLQDSQTLHEIASLTPVYTLILNSSILSRQYRTALEQAELDT